jgi:hypothetical protein
MYFFNKKVNLFINIKNFNFFFFFYEKKINYKTQKNLF